MNNKDKDKDISAVPTLRLMMSRGRREYRGLKNQMSDEQLDRQFLQQVDVVRERLKTLKRTRDITLCPKWIGILLRTTKEEKYARNCLLVLMLRQLKTGGISYPFTDLKNCNRDVCCVLRDYEKRRKRKDADKDKDKENVTSPLELRVPEPSSVSLENVAKSRENNKFKASPWREVIAKWRPVNTQFSSPKSNSNSKLKQKTVEKTLRKSPEVVQLYMKKNYKQRTSELDEEQAEILPQKVLPNKKAILPKGCQSSTTFDVFPDRAERDLKERERKLREIEKRKEQEQVEREKRERQREQQRAKEAELRIRQEKQLEKERIEKEKEHKEMLFKVHQRREDERIRRESRKCEQRVLREQEKQPKRKKSVVNEKEQLKKDEKKIEQQLKIEENEEKQQKIKQQMENKKIEIDEKKHMMNQKENANLANVESEKKIEQKKSQKTVLIEFPQSKSEPAFRVIVSDYDTEIGVEFENIEKGEDSEPQKLKQGKNDKQGFKLHVDKQRTRLQLAEEMIRKIAKEKKQLEKEIRARCEILEWLKVPENQNQILDEPRLKAGNDDNNNANENANENA
ncbi:hypothetical protein ACLKA6_016196 [Drosophila palustris]